MEYHSITDSQRLPSSFIYTSMHKFPILHFYKALNHSADFEPLHPLAKHAGAHFMFSQLRVLLPKLEKNVLAK